MGSSQAEGYGRTGAWANAVVLVGLAALVQSLGIVLAPFMTLV